MEEKIKRKVGFAKFPKMLEWAIALQNAELINNCVSYLLQRYWNNLFK